MTRLDRGVSSSKFSGGESPPLKQIQGRKLPPWPKKLPPSQGGSPLESRSGIFQKVPPPGVGVPRLYFQNSPPGNFRLPPSQGGSRSVNASWLSWLRHQFDFFSYPKIFARLRRGKSSKNPSLYFQNSIFRRLRRAKIVVFTSRSPKFSAPAAGYY